ncbi:hypothetical protein [Streptomyces sp. NPDC006274]|uniref:hypothetical protein n=1 Tax=unclassified Streptomyces TaxID=2593676 RepID=UPI0033A598F6
MTIQIAPLAALLLVVSIAVGITVFKYTARTAGRGDLGTAIGSGAAVAMVLALLLAPGFGQTPANPATSTTTPGAAEPVQ